MPKSITIGSLPVSVLLMLFHLVLYPQELNALEDIEQNQIPKLALVIGVERYSDTNLQKATNATSDAILVSRALEGLGFDVALMQNSPTFDQIHSAIENFRDSDLRDWVNRGVKPLMVFYFSGHGFSIDNGNYILPSDAAYKSPASLYETSIEISNSVVSQLSQLSSLVVFLDSCRRRSVRTVRGTGTTLQKILKSGFAHPSGHDNAFYGFAARLGQLASGFVHRSDRNSPFAKALVAPLQQRQGQTQPPIEDTELSEYWNDVQQHVEEATRTHNGPFQAPEATDRTYARLYFSPGPMYLSQVKVRFRRLMSKLAHLENREQKERRIRQHLNKYPMNPFSQFLNAILSGSTRS